MKYLTFIFTVSCSFADTNMQLYLSDLRTDVIHIVTKNHDESILNNRDSSKLLSLKKNNLNDINSYFEGFKAGLYSYAENNPALDTALLKVGDLTPSERGLQRAIELAISKNGDLSLLGVETLFNYEVNVQIVNKHVFSSDRKSLIVKFQSSNSPVVEKSKVKSTKAYMFDKKNFGLLIIKHGVDVAYENIIFVVQ